MCFLSPIKARDEPLEHWELDLASVTWWWDQDKRRQPWDLLSCSWYFIFYFNMKLNFILKHRDKHLRENKIYYYPPKHLFSLRLFWSHVFCFCVFFKFHKVKQYFSQIYSPSNSLANWHNSPENYMAIL